MVTETQLREFVSRGAAAQDEVQRIIQFAGLNDLDLVLLRHKMRRTIRALRDHDFEADIDLELKRRGVKGV